MVDLPGFISGSYKRQHLEEAAVFVMPSVHENFGMGVVEAMGAGLPVVVSRGVQIWPEIESAGAGLVVEPKCPEALARALLSVLSDEKKRRTMGRLARRLVETEYSPTRVGAALRQLYRSASEGRAAVREVFDIESEQG